jgi:hypothetical protein
MRIDIKITLSLNGWKLFGFCLNRNPTNDDDACNVSFKEI